ncbi:E3 ubiquitin-protein ligase TRIM21-like isoform X2 [Salminus brasiliensis]|uniref:E3 ubiquitin-protein ligase TRIM21-like isoform X2 n=1 Tax=Salminus brasiliensis TaxID=930266 RepID=UPI003B82F2C6
MAESSSPQPRQGRRKSMDYQEQCKLHNSSFCLCGDQFQCCICLDMFTDPVSTPCGHNFCKTCLTQYWNNTQHCHCPLCKEEFTKRPELKINTTLREIADHFKKKSVPDKPEVLCDVCTGQKLKAFKSCLNCGATFCKTHLELHTVGTLRNHKLIDPVENVGDYICQKHERPLELFCRDDQTCVCQFCTEGEHKNHNTVPIEEENEQIRTQLGETQADVQKMIQDRLKKIKEIKHSVELRKRNTEKEITDSVEVFTVLIRSIERSQAELLKVMEERQKTAERQAEDLIKELEQEITELKRRDTELEQLSHTEDHLHLLQTYPSLCSPLHTKNWTDMSIDPHLSVEPVKKKLSQLQKSLNEKLTEWLNNAAHILVSTELKKIQQHAVDVTLDPDTAHPNLILSANGKQVTCGDTRQNLSDNQRRFNKSACVLGKEGFSSGRFYFEVQVSGKTKWDLGVARESINRKVIIKLTQQNGFWTLWLKNENEYEACADPGVSLSMRKKLQKVGVFVDYEEGLVSFYDVEARSHIYSFTGQSFTEKLYPYFSPCSNDGGKNSAPLIISPVCETK